MEIFSILGKIAIDTKDAGTAIEGIGKKVQGLAKTLEGAGTAVTGWGKKLTATVTTAGIAIGGLAINSAMKFEDSMANINTLLDDDSHLAGYEGAIKNFSNSTGMSLDTVSAGMYQTISSIGDGGEATERMFNIMGKSAKAGGAEVSDSVSLISAGMKGYNSVNEETAQKISDLGFQTAKLGVTTFPELAKSMQPLFPLSSSMGISYEELFGVMATGTGVTGNTAEVTTQFKGVLSNLMQPTKGMTDLMVKYGYSNAQAMIETEGLSGFLRICQTETGGQSDKLAELFSSTEALTIMTALTGSQFDTFNDKLGQMQTATGATDKAYEKMATNGDKVRIAFNLCKNTLMELGATLLTTLAPTIQTVCAKVSEACTWFTNLDDGTKNIILRAAGLVMALGPVLMIVGKVVTGIGGIIGIGGKLIGGIGGLVGKLGGMGAIVGKVGTLFSSVLLPALSSVGSFIFTTLIPAIASVVASIVGGLITAIGSVVSAIFTTLIPAFVAAIVPILPIIAAIAAVIAIGVLLYKNWDEIKAFAGKCWDGIKGVVKGAAEAVGGFISGCAKGVSDKWNELTTKTSEAWGNIKESASTKASEMKDKVIEHAMNLKAKQEEIFSNIKEVVVTKFGEMKDRLVEHAVNLKAKQEEVFSNMKEKLVEHATNLKEKQEEIFSNMKEAVVTKFSEMKEKTVEHAVNLKAKQEEIASGMKEAIVSKYRELQEKATALILTLKNKVVELFTNLKEKAVSIVTNIKEDIVKGFENLKESATKKFTAFTDGIVNVFTSAKDKFWDIIEKIKGFFDFDWELPKIKLPHFSVSGSFSLSPPSIPKFGIDWYAKGGVMMNPTAFGVNPITGNTMAGGEAGAEAIAPISVLQKYVAEAVAEQNGEIAEVLRGIYSMLSMYMPELAQKQVVLSTGETIGALAAPMNVALGKLAAKKERGK